MPVTKYGRGIYDAVWLLVFALNGSLNMSLTHADSTGIKRISTNESKSYDCRS